MLRNAIREIIVRVMNWIDEHREELNEMEQRFWSRFDRIAMYIVRLAMIGLVLHIVSCFAPEIAEKCPVLYGWFTGAEKLLEFLMKTCVKGVYSIFTGQYRQFCDEWWTDVHQLWNMFCDWIQSI